MTEAAIAEAVELLSELQQQDLEPEALDMIERMVGLGNRLYSQAETFSETTGNDLIKDLVRG